MRDDRKRFDDFGHVLTVRQAAKVLGVSENFLRERIRKEEVPGVVRLGRRILISKEILRKFMEGQT